MSAKHANISIFVPHIGCPNMCSFCNQRHITGRFTAPSKSDVSLAVKTAQSSANYDPKNTEIAFFGGSFTAINRAYMVRLLSAASRFVEEGVVSGIRISTRPDAINDEILDVLEKYHVTSIELGAQSLNDTVLSKNNRGHSVQDVIDASKLIKSRGFSLGLQMMTGLYYDSDELAVKTAEKIIELAPDTVRIYPTIVLKDTDLAALYADKKYTPQTLEEAVELASKLLLMFEKAGIKVIRLGLHTIENDAYIAGPWHPAFSELCQSRVFFESALSLLNKLPIGKYNLIVSNNAISKMIGQKRSNIIHLARQGYDCTVSGNILLGNYEIIVERR